MSANTTIEWTGDGGRTWNPVRGCSLESPGCTHCYAMNLAHRFSGPGAPFEGLTRAREKGGPVWTGKVRQAPRSVLAEPLSWRKPARVFVNSMSDLFHEGFSDTVIDEVFAVMMAGRVFENLTEHTFQVLTKRAARMADYFATPPAQLVARWAEAGDGWIIVGDGDSEWFSEYVEREASVQRGPIGNVVETRPWGFLENVIPRHLWLGISVEDQPRADERVPHLLRVPDTFAAVRFLSCEPLLGPVDLSEWMKPESHCSGCEESFDGLPALCPRCSGDSLVSTWGRAQAARWRSGERYENGGPSDDGPEIGWVIAGAESGCGARSMDEGWVRSMRDQCAAAGVPFFYKQRLNEKGRKVSLPVLDGVQHAAFPAEASR